MATEPTTRATLLARRLRVDIDTAIYPASQYQRLMGVQELKPVDELRTESDEAYEDDGAAREAVTGYNWRLELKLLHSTDASGASRDPVHAFLLSKFLAAKQGVANGEFGVRWYDRNGLSGDSFEGRAYVKAWPQDGGNPGALETVSVVIQGQGPLAAIDNPSADMTPTVTGLNPATGPAGGGDLVHVYGTHFGDAIDVDFGVNAADDFTVVNDSHIVAIVPAGVAGVAEVTVTTADGTSATAGTANDYTYV